MTPNELAHLMLKTDPEHSADISIQEVEAALRDIDFIKNAVMTTKTPELSTFSSNYAPNPDNQFFELELWKQAEKEVESIGIQSVKKALIAAINSGQDTEVDEILKNAMRCRSERVLRSERLQNLISLGKYLKPAVILEGQRGKKKSLFGLTWFKRRK